MALTLPERVRRYVGVNMTQNAFTLAAGQLAVSAAPAFAPFKVEPQRGVQLSPFGKGANDSTFSYRVWLADRSRLESQASNLGAYQLFLYGSGLATLSTATGAGSEPTSPGANDLNEVYTTERFADTLTWTLANFGTQLEAAYGVASTYHSPADNTPAMLFIPDIADHFGVIFEVALGGSATAANALLRGTR